MSYASPEIHTLDRPSIDALLSRNSVGRIAFTYGGRVDVQPIHYVYNGGWIYGRTSAGSKLRSVLHNCWVAFEVDEVEDVFRWRSAIVHGACYVLDPEGSPHEREVYEQAVTLMRRLIPETLTDADPVPSRTALFRVHVDEATGREAGEARGRA